MTKLAIFLPLAKADATQRMVYGYFDETPDRAGEIFDYESSKEQIRSWSDGLFKTSGGKSYGNVRGQHNGKIAAGKLTEIVFNDLEKRIEFGAKIVDDQEWAKVEEGVYTGFSPGGAYAKRWRDGANHRYTAKVAELSIVDVPCNPTATFTMIKADGLEEEVEFAMGKAYEPGNAATKARSIEMAKAILGDSAKDAAVLAKSKDFVGPARADLIAENAHAELLKVAAEVADPDDQGDPGDEDPETKPSEDPAEKTDDPVGKLEGALAKADEALKPQDAPAGAVVISPLQSYASALTGTLLKANVDLVVAPPSQEAVALIGADLGKSIEAVAQIRAKVEPILSKGLYSLSAVVSTLQSMSWIAQDAISESTWEGDSSPLPQMAVDLVNGLKAFLIAMVEEEVSEMLARAAKESEGSVDLIIADLTGDGDDMELAAQIVDLVKASPRFEKAGARNSATDAGRIQTIHDKASELGADCGADKAAGLKETNDRLQKAVESSLPRLEGLLTVVDDLRKSAADREVLFTGELEKMAKQIEKLGGQPAPTKIQLASMISKEEDAGALGKALDPIPGSIEAAKALPPEQRAAALERIAHNINARGR